MACGPEPNGEEIMKSTSNFSAASEVFVPALTRIQLSEKNNEYIL